MELNKILKNTIITIIKHCNEHELKFIGSISDFFLYKDFNLKYNFKIHDLDVVIYEIDTLNKLNSILGVEARLVHEHKKYEYKQYYISVNNELNFDVFLKKKDNIFFPKENFKYTEFEGERLSYYDLRTRYEILRLITTDDWNVIPYNLERQLKHLKKLNTYKRLLDEGKR